MGDVLLRTAIGGFLAPLFWLVVLAVPLWLIRKFAPRAEWWLYSPLSKVIARLASATGLRRRGLRRLASKAPVRHRRHPTGPA